MASVAADTSAIAPSPPLPSRPDAAPPAGPPGGFADLLDASSAPAPAPQPQGASAAPAGTGSPAAPSAGNGSASAAGADAASSTSRNGKDTGGPKSNNDQTAADSAGGSAVDVTVVAGLPVPPFAFVPLPVTDQTPAASQDAQTASSDAAAPTQEDPAGSSQDRKDASAPAGPVVAGLIAALPGIVPVIAPAGPDSSAPASTGPAAATLPATPIPGTVMSALSTDASTAGPDAAAIDAPSPQLPGAPQASRAASHAPQDLLTAGPALASAPPPAGDLQADALPQLSPSAPGIVASDQNARSAPAGSTTPPVSPPGTLTLPAAVAPLTPPTAVTPLTAEIPVAASTGSPREAEAIPIALPTQVAVKLAAPAHANDDATSDSGTDVLLGFAGASIGATTSPGSNGQPGTAIPPSFNPSPTVQPMPGPVTAPPHVAVMPDAVPLAGIPIAIVTRAEAGERKFEIRLDPPDLGRIEVQLNVDSTGRATSHLVVDRADTLDLLRRDAPALERALQSAGLTTDDGSLQFSLRDQSFAGRDQGAPAPFAPPAPTTVAENDSAPIDAALRRYGSPAGLGGGVDIRV